MNPVEKAIRKLDATQRRFTPTAFVFGVVKKYGDDNGGVLASNLAYSAFVSIFPLLLILTTLLGLVASVNPSVRASVLEAVAGALPADRIFVDSITASITGYATMTDLEKVRTLRLWVYQHTPKEGPLIHDQIVNLRLKDAYALFANGTGGVWCAGNATMLSRVYKAAG